MSATPREIVVLLCHFTGLVKHLQADHMTWIDKGLQTSVLSVVLTLNPLSLIKKSNASKAFSSLFWCPLVYITTMSRCSLGRLRWSWALLPYCRPLFTMKKFSIKLRFNLCSSSLPPSNSLTLAEEVTVLSVGKHCRVIRDIVFELFFYC